MKDWGYICFFLVLFLEGLRRGMVAVRVFILLLLLVNRVDVFTLRELILVKIGMDLLG